MNDRFPMELKCPVCGQFRQSIEAVASKPGIIMKSTCEACRRQQYEDSYTAPAHGSIDTSRRYDR